METGESLGLTEHPVWPDLQTLEQVRVLTQSTPRWTAREEQQLRLTSSLQVHPHWHTQVNLQYNSPHIPFPSRQFTENFRSYWFDSHYQNPSFQELEDEFLYPSIDYY